MEKRTELAAYRPDGFGYQEFSREFVSRLTRAPRKESWGRNFIQLAWTARGAARILAPRSPETATSISPFRRQICSIR